jgi:glycolate oxidase FAD binding subunit
VIALSDEQTWPDSPAGGRLGDGCFAWATFRPENEAEVCERVREQVAAGQALYPQGGKTSLDYGEPPARPGVAIDLRSLQRVIDYPHADMTLTAEAGMTISEVQRILGEHRQRLQIDAPRPGEATLGGVFATNASGPRRYGAGRPRDQIIGVQFVSAEGKVVKGGGRVVKNVAGYDFPKLLTGSMGTLGLITQVTVKVRPIPEATAIVWTSFSDITSLAQSLDALNGSETRPVAIEVLNQSACARLGIDLGSTGGPWTLLLGFEDNEASVSWQVDRIATELGRPDVHVRRGDECETLWSALVDLAAIETGPVSFVANLRPSGVSRLLEALPADQWAVQAHAGNGIVRGHALENCSWETIAVEIDSLRRSAISEGGNLIVSRCPTDQKPRLRVWGEPRPDWALAERLKSALDPQRVLNPGRFVGTI